MSEQELDEIVQITVEDFNPDDRTDMLDNHEDDDERLQKKKRKLSISQENNNNNNNNQDIFFIKNLLVSFTASISQRLEGIESRLYSLDATCKALGRKLDNMLPCAKSPIQVPMVAGSPQGATQTWNKVRCVVPQTNVIVSSEHPKGTNDEDNPLENLLSNTVTRKRQNTIMVKVPAPDESQEEQDSCSDASDTVSNGGQSSNAQNGQNVTLITLNSEDDYPVGTWLGDENNTEMRVRCPVSAADMLHITTNCRTAEKMALTLLDYLFHREVQALSNLSGQGKHGKKQLDPLMIYGIRCHLFHKFRITESDWYRIKQSIDSKCRTAWRRKQRGQSLAVKSFSKRTPRGTSGEGGTAEETGHIEAATQQTLHYTLANQQVQFHRIGEDGQVQVIPQGQLHIAQVPQGEEVQITQDSEGNLQIHQVHVGQDGQVLRGAQLIAVASTDGGATAVEGSPLPSDIQVQYVQLAPVADHTAAVQAVELTPALQADMEVKEAIQGAIQGENGEVLQIVTSVAT
ncbi:protein BANP isoform X1 [Gasterosteus aculeatus]|uniref:protein BANP-like isoform X1 n=1 Tax=Gasterosteus aculeatus aculeatus TaxID=481459 RepID=UPI001A99F203|nr:protein BANP-like isoform X1 [Gasterosteus aculeatus aculeatus]XP_040023929.1 protein BANP-like isoform X1 [Gasterosteus aculeatus aculeatus]XP_040023930.1 protein BANP-like isoform X1 [Gasterosteus aculeatus aculeatus]